MSDPTSQHGCGGSGGCNHCMGAHADDGSDDHPRGWRLVLPAVLALLVPILGAIVGAAIIGATPNGSTAGAAIGFAVGVGLAIGVIKLSANVWKERPQHDHAA